MVPTPIVALNRAVALAEVEGPQAALVVVDDLDLDRYHLYHATRADLLHRLARADEAVTAYDRALDLATNTAERRFLIQRRDAVRAPSSSSLLAPGVPADSRSAGAGNR
jgi:RNA polymerase sigma-70 factor (ECF subfamily)